MDKIDSFKKEFVEPIISPVFTYILSLIFNDVLYPCALKIAKVLPTFKSGNLVLLETYRLVPISFFFSKVVVVKSL